MPKPIRFLPFTLFVAGAAGLAHGQDSVSQSGCSGDALPPWRDASSPLGSDQANDYVVDLSPLFTSWGTRFGVAPLVKASRPNSSTTGTATFAAQAISRRVIQDHAFASSSYAAWNGPGLGVNNDPSVNAVPGSVAIGTKTGSRSAVAFSESGTSDLGTTYHGIVTATLDIDRSLPSRLHVRRIQSAVNGCSPASDLAGLYVGGVDERGNVAFRTDDVSTTMSTACGLLPLPGSNYFLVDSLARDTDALNAITGDYPGGGFDIAATKWLVRNDATTSLNTPCLQPASVLSGSATLLGSNFTNQFVRGQNFGSMLADFSEFAATVSGVKGNLSYSVQNLSSVSSTHGIAALLAKTGGNPTNAIDVFGLGPSGNVTGAIALKLPPTLTDSATGFVSLGPPGNMQFNHYRSQTFSNGGNGQVAMRVLGNGDFLAAAEVDHGSFAAPSNNWPVNLLAVVKRDTGTGAATWTMAGYVDDQGGGKPILDGPTGNVIGRMIPMVSLSGFNLPAFSGPAMDANGNVWFLSSIELFATGELSIGLLRAVLDPATFSYRLELVLRLGDTFAGPNSGRNWQIRDLRVIDSNSIDSATIWSGNVTDDAFLGFDASHFAPQDPRSLGGLVLAATVIYDTDEDGNFLDCHVMGGQDETYSALLYLGPLEASGAVEYGSGCAGSGGFVPRLSLSGLPAPGASIELKLRHGLGGSQSIVFFGLTPASLPIGGGFCQLRISPLLPLSLALPLSGSGNGNGEFSLVASLPPATTPGFSFTLQAFIADAGMPATFSNSNGLELTIQ